MAADATMDMTGYLNLEGRMLNNAGTATLSGNQINMSDGATIDNQSGATMTIEGAEQIGRTGSAPNAFKNEGTLIRSGAAGDAVVSSAAFDNSGSVQVQSGELDLAGDGDSTGSFDVATGATLGFGFGGFGGTETLEHTASISGGGGVTMNGGTLSMMGGFAEGSTGNRFRDL